jgi:hypothetical protein
MTKIHEIAQEAEKYRPPEKKVYESEKRWMASHKHRIDNEAYEAAVKFAGLLQSQYGRTVSPSEAILEMWYRLEEVK